MAGCAASWFLERRGPLVMCEMLGHRLHPYAADREHFLSARLSVTPGKRVAFTPPTCAIRSGIWVWRSTQPKLLSLGPKLWQLQRQFQPPSWRLRVILERRFWLLHTCHTFIVMEPVSTPPSSSGVRLTRMNF